jgi:hypothetical protein
LRESDKTHYDVIFYPSRAQRTIKAIAGRYELNSRSSKSGLIGEVKATKYPHAEKSLLTNLGVRSASIVTIVMIVALTVMLNVGSVYAQTLVLTPNQVTQGMSVQVTGSDFQPSEDGQIQVYPSNAGTCGLMPVMTLDASTDSRGNLNPVTIQTSGFSAGTYCIEANGFMSFPSPVDLIISAAVTTTPTAALQIPGFPIEAILIGIALGLVALAASRRQRQAHSRVTCLLLKSYADIQLYWVQ